MKTTDPTPLPPDLPPSPCVGICSACFDDVCRGCGRTLTEISNWLFMSDAERQAIWRRVIAQGWQPRRQGRRS